MSAGTDSVGAGRWAERGAATDLVVIVVISGDVYLRKYVYVSGTCLLSSPRSYWDGMNGWHAGLPYALSNTLERDASVFRRAWHYSPARRPPAYAMHPVISSCCFGYTTSFMSLLLFVLLRRGYVQRRHVVVVQCCSAFVKNVPMLNAREHGWILGGWWVSDWGGWRVEAIVSASLHSSRVSQPLEMISQCWTFYLECYCHKSQGTLLLGKKCFTSYVEGGDAMPQKFSLEVILEA